MARLPALVSALAEVDGRDRSGLENVARIIREAGHITTTKRGVGASEMTARDVANLFLGANGSDAAKDAPLAVERFRSLRPHIVTPRDPSLQVFRDIAEAGNFGSALEILIEGMPEVVTAAMKFFEAGYPEKLATSHKRDLFKYGWDSPGVGFLVGLILRHYSAEIICETYVARPPGDEGVGGMWRREFTAKFIVDGDRFMEGYYGHAGRHDRKIELRFTGLTFLRLWAALAQSSPEEIWPVASSGEAR
jgi:hypothetical protein